MFLKKRLIAIAFLGLALITLTGCGGGGYYGEDYASDSQYDDYQSYIEPDYSDYQEDYYYEPDYRDYQEDYYYEPDYPDYYDYEPNYP